MIDHVGFGVSDYEASKAYYERALEPLGIELLMEPVSNIGGFGREGKPFFWISRERPVQSVLDPDGNNIEAVCHRPA